LPEGVTATICGKEWIESDGILEDDRSINVKIKLAGIERVLFDDS
jgi:hypothetical protein